MTLQELETMKRAFSVHSSADGELEHDALMQSLGLEPGKVYQELEMTSRYADIRREVSHTNAEVSLHSHSFYEIICCHGVTDVEYLIGSERHRLKPGDIIFVPPGVSHRPLLPEVMAEPYRRDILWLSTSFIHGLSQFYPHALTPLLEDSHIIRTSKPDGNLCVRTLPIFCTNPQSVTWDGKQWSLRILWNSLFSSSER